MANICISDLHILLVEPSPTQRKIIVDHLQQAGITGTEGVGDGKQALEEMSKYKPDLVISAFYLPDMTGTELVTQMRINTEFEYVPFMLVSSETRHHMLEPVRQAGIVAILPKPFVHDDLKRALYATLDYIEPEDLDLDNYDVHDVRVLVIDDSDLARKHIKRILSNMGMHQIQEAHNGREAVLMLADNQFDLIVTDYNMPEMDGSELIHNVRHSQTHASVPVLMVTSEQDQARLASVEQAGVSAICDKPFIATGVRRTLQLLLNKT